MKAQQKVPPLVVSRTPQLQAQQAAQMLCRAAEDASRQRGLGCLALSGGSTPHALFAELARPPLAAAFPWHTTHFFWVDERMLPYDHPHSNYGTAGRRLFDLVSVPAANLHPMPVDGDSEEAARQYELLLRSFFSGHDNGPPVFDAVLLGLGTDGHTASLFPGTLGGCIPGRWVRAVRGGDPPMPRLTLTEKVLNLGRRVLFLVSGRGKAEIVQRVLEDECQDLPATRIRPQNGTATWLIDRGAASLLTDKSLQAIRRLPPAAS